MDTVKFKKIMANYWDMKHPEVDDFVNEALALSEEEAEERYEKADEFLYCNGFYQQYPALTSGDMKIKESLHIASGKK